MRDSSSPPEQYVLYHEGRWYYYLDTLYGDQTVYADGQPVPLRGPRQRALLETLVEAATWAPSGGNLQAYSFVVVTDRRGMLRIEVRVPGDALLGLEGEGFAQIMWELQGERLVAAIGAVEGAERGLERTRRYLDDRQAFGRPLSRFQALQHRVADLSAEVAAVRALVYDCCDKWNRGIYATTEIAMCKLAAAQMSFRVADEVLQLHGGHGYARGGAIERAWRDARLMRIGGGTDEVQREMRIFLNAIERHYGKRPIIYTTIDFYRDNRLHEFRGYDWWLRSVAAQRRNASCTTSSDSANEPSMRYATPIKNCRCGSKSSLMQPRLWARS